MNKWVSAFRLRTLALSFALIITGTALAMQQSLFSCGTFVLALTTTLFLQILSNLSNDYGDAVSGVDMVGRIGPSRAVQSGAISGRQMKRAIVVFAVLSLISGISLLYASRGVLGVDGTVFLFGIGLLCIIAAITYTIGRRPYGYRGLGDVSVFVFFGIVGVAGSYSLFAGRPSLAVFLPASAVGLLSVGVLNMNNLRDVDGDRRSGKNTLVVRMGERWACIYQLFLVAFAMLLLLAYIVIYGVVWQAICFLTLPVFIRHLVTLFQTNDHNVIDAQLRVVSVGTMFTSLLFMLGTNLSL